MLVQINEKKKKTTEVYRSAKEHVNKSYAVLFNAAHMLFVFQIKGRAATCPKNEGDKLPQLVRHAHRCKSVVIVNESY